MIFFLLLLIFFLSLITRINFSSSLITITFFFFFFYSKLCIIIFQILFKTNNIVEFIRFILNFYRFLIMNIVNIVEQSIIDYALIDSCKKYKLRVCNVIFVGRNSMTLSLGHHRPDYSMRMSPPVDVACAFI